VLVLLTEEEVAVLVPLIHQMVFNILHLLVDLE
jgi:hypothetical protein